MDTIDTIDTIDTTNKFIYSDNNIDYNGLLASMTVIKNILCTDKNSKVGKNIGYDIIRKLFNSGNDGLKPNAWFDVGRDYGGKLVIYSKFKNRKIYDHSKDNTDCYIWKPTMTSIIIQGLRIAKKCPHQVYCFKSLSNIFVFFLAQELYDKKIDDVTIIIDALCDVLKQKCFLEKKLIELKS